MDNPRPSFGCHHHHRKRTHDQMDDHGSIRSSLRLSSLDSETGGSGSASRTRQHSTPDLPRRRFIGDGLDLRRPATGTVWNPAQNVIDLTEEAEEETPRPQEPTRPSTRATRPPRFPRGMEIIDLSADASPTEETARGNHEAPASDNSEIQMVSWRARRDAPRPAQPEAQPEPQPILPFGMRTVNLSEDDDDEDVIMADVQFLEARPARNPPPRRLAPNVRRHDERLAPLFRRFNVIQRVTVGNIFGMMPGEMDFTRTGFDLGPEPQERTPPPPVYDAPPPAPEGFTRSPAEDDVLICPNCRDELCTGDDDPKRQVWIVKGCGHTYCGQCTGNRFKSKRKGKEPVNAAPAFSSCVVQGCGRSTRSMIQIYL